MKGSTQAHTALVKEVLFAVGSLRVCRVWENQTGMAYRDGKPIRYGCIGSPDIEGIVEGGKYLGIEIKTGQAVQSPQQIAFQNMIRKMGGYYFVCRSTQEALDSVIRAASG